MRLVSDWKATWRYYSTLAMGLATAVQGVWVGLPDDMRGSIPSDWVTYVTMAVLFLGIIGRLVEQE